MTIDKREFDKSIDKSIDKSKSLCNQVKELLQKNKETAYSYEEIKKELISINDNYPNTIIGYIDLGLDMVMEIALIPCLINLENSGLIQRKLINNETYYIWRTPNIKVKK